MSEITSSGNRLTPAPEPRAAGSASGGREAESRVVEAGAAPRAAEITGNSAPRSVAEAQNVSEGEQLVAAVARLNDYAQSIKRELQFSIDGDTGKPVVRVLDGETQELVRQMPSDLALSLAKRLEELGTPELVNARI